MLTPTDSDQQAALRARIRRDVRRARRSLEGAERMRRSHQLCTRLARAGVLTRFSRFTAFFANDAEVDLSPLTRRLEGIGKHVYMPVIRDRKLWFFEVRRDTALTRNRFGIPEPRGSGDRRIALGALDVVLMPLVAFDAHGNRIGMGGGYYNRTFAFKRLRRQRSRPLLIGVGFDFQRVDVIPAEPWDVPLDAAVTDREFLWFPSRVRGTETLT